MKIILLAAGAAALSLIGGSAFAAGKHHKSYTSAAYAEPKQPIPYAQLDAYMKASPTQRAQNDWWSGQTMASGASTGSTANTAARAPAASTPDAAPSASTTPSDSSATPPSPSGDTSSSPSATPSSPSSGQVNPPSTPPSATPPK